MRGCNAADHQLYDANFAGPLPWIGLYVAGASLLCALAMSLDALRGFRSRKLWFPCYWFSLNATTLTLLGIAAKFPVDLNTSMPGRIDQLSKLSGTVLLCIVMGNFMPSLGDMSGSDILSNVVALAILVITVIANICIQMGTGVIYVFWFEHIVVMFFLVVVLVTFVATAFAVPVMKNEMEEKFGEALNTMSGREQKDDHSAESLKDKVEKYWLMAHTGSPQYVVGRSATCIASGAFCLVAGGILIEAYLRSHFQGSMFCSGVSDYGWSTKLVFCSQAIAIFVGSVAPAIRWFNARSFRSSHECRSCWKDLTVEEHWVERFKDWKDAHMPFINSGRKKRRVIYIGKNLVSDVLIKLQEVEIILSKIVRMLSVLPLNGILGWRRSSTSTSNRLDNPSRFVLHLKGEEEFVDVITRNEREDVKRWIERGRRKKPTKLIKLIKENNSKSRGGFAGLVELDRHKVVSLVPPKDEPNRCWAMPIVNLTAIAMALPNVPKKEKESLLKQVYQGLRYVRLVEKNLDGNGLVYVRDVADKLWTSIELHRMWFGIDLQMLASDNDDCTSSIRHLEQQAKSRFKVFWDEQVGKGDVKHHVEWPGEELAHHCMYKVARTILDDYEKCRVGRNSSYPYLPRTDDNLFRWIQETISDVIRACLTNIPRVIYLECVCNKIEDREERVRNAALLLGEAEEDILPILEEQKAQLTLESSERFYIDTWITRLQESNMP